MRATFCLFYPPLPRPFKFGASVLDISTIELRVGKPSSLLRLEPTAELKSFIGDLCYALYPYPQPAAAIGQH